MTNIQPLMEHFERPDPVLTNKIVTHLKSQGIFDQFRRECMADVDTKPAYHNLRQRVEGSVAAFLRLNPWRPDMNKNQLRDNLRKHIQSGGFLDIGVDRIVDQVVNPKIYTVFLPKVEEVVQNCLGMENDKPTFEPPPPTEVKSEPPKFQDKHNLAPRAKLPAPLMGPTLKPLQPPQAEGRSSPGREKLIDNGGDTDTEETADKKYVVDDNDLEEKEEDDEDDEESPPFERHSEGDRLILGMRSDSSENSNDSQVVTTIVDDSLEERIDNNETAIKEESDKKDEDSSSDEYVPKTPTINMEESDGTVLEFNSISEYKQYQTKFEEDSFGNVEEVVSSQCINDNHDPVKEERSSNEEDFVRSQKRKFNIDSYDDASNSSSDKESTGDEIKPAVFESFKKKQFKFEEYDNENDTCDLSINDAENEDYYTERSLDITDSKIKEFENEHHEKHKGSSTSSKESGKSFNTNHKEHGESSNPQSSKEKTAEKDHQEKTRSSNSSKYKKDIHKKSENHENPRDHHKDRDRKRSESSSKHNEKDARSKHPDKEREMDKDKKRSKSSERLKKDKEDADKNRKESRHEHKDHESKSRDYHEKVKKKHNSRDRHSDGKEVHDSTHKRDKERRDDSKHHSSSRHSHRSSSEKHKSDKEHKHKGSSERHKSHDEKSDKDSKDESRKKYRQHCKYSSDKDENRRSSDRDSSGPSSSRTQMPSSSKSTSSRTNRESKVDPGERTSSNSENTVSDNIETLQNHSNVDSINEHRIASPDILIVEDSCNEPDLMGSDLNSSKEEGQQFSENNTIDSVNKLQGEKTKSSDYLESSTEVLDSPQHQTSISEDQMNSDTDDYMDSLDRSTGTENFNITSEKKQDLATSSVLLHDSSSEKENIEQVIKQQINSELDGNNTDATLDEDSTVIKFKKPKIAKNIHEVKKIMEARRHLKRMEKKRMKLLIKYNSEEYESDEKPPNEDELVEEPQDDLFRGFEDDFSSEKIKKYDCLTERLENEASQLEKLINYEQINSNLITSWIDLSPDFDPYIENTLKGKVHRRYRVLLPPICDEYYKYDAEQNVYFLIQNSDVAEQKEVLVDSNLNNLNSIYTTDQQENKTSYSKVISQKRNLSEGPVPCTNSEITHEDCEYTKQNSPKRKISCKKTQPAIEVVMVSTNASAKNATKDISKKIDKSSDIIASPNIAFSLTFNQTYDEVLKEKAQNSVVSSKREVEEMYKTPLTVVRITNSKTSEQVFMKKFQSNSGDKVEVPRITRSETTVNGKVIENHPDSKQIPLISRITKAKNISSLSTSRGTSRSANGVVSPVSTSNFKEEFPRGVSQKMINDVIGIQDAISDQGNISDQSSQSGEEFSEQGRRRTKVCRQQQRYDSSDLYKPRLQLSSRRIRAAGSSPEGTPPVPQAMATRKRSATSDLNTAAGKRRR